VRRNLKEDSASTKSSNMPAMALLTVCGPPNGLVAAELTGRDAASLSAGFVVQFQ
jgi:hypothetical protein